MGNLPDRIRGGPVTRTRQRVVARPMERVPVEPRMAVRWVDRDTRATVTLDVSITGVGFGLLYDALLASPRCLDVEVERPPV